MRGFLRITAAGLTVALAVTPALAQTGARPQSEQQAPQNSNTQDRQSKGTMRDTPPKGGIGNSTSGTSGTGMPSDSMRGQKAGKANVRQIQEALKAEGHDPGPVDGVMGPQTKEALRAYQRSQSLTETGRLDQPISGKPGVGGATGQRQPSR